MKSLVTGVASLALGVLCACRESAHGSRAASSSPAAANDSAFSVAKALQRFRADIGEAANRLDGPASRDALVRHFVRALNAGDVAALRDLMLSRAEFAYLYYPESPQSRPPYGLEPQLMWLQISARSDRGLSRALRAFAGGRLRYLSYACEAEPGRAGAVRLYNACVISHQENGATITEPLFGSIVERDGRYKFVGYANRL